MHYLKRDAGFGSVQQWAIQHRQSLEPITVALDKHLLTGQPLVVSSLAILTAAELEAIFTGTCRIVSVAESIDTRRTTGLGDIHWNTLRLLAPAFKAWATAPPASNDPAGADIGKLMTERDNLRARITDLTLDLAALRAGVASPVAGPDDDLEPEEPAIEPPAPDVEPAPAPLPEGAALWSAVCTHFRDRFPLQSAFVDGAVLLGVNDGSVSLGVPAILGDAVVASLEESLMAVGLRQRAVLCIVQPSEDDAPDDPVVPPLPVSPKRQRRAAAV